jgi:hypothetical protein
MVVRTINLSQEAELCLEAIKRKDTSFNLSGFVQDELMKFQGDEGDYNDLLVKIQIKKASLSQITQEVEKMEKDAEEIKNKKDIENKIKTEQEMKIKDRENSKRKDRNDTFKEVTGRDMTDKEYLEFDNGFMSGQWNIWTYAEKLKDKPLL